MFLSGDIYLVWKDFLSSRISHSRQTSHSHERHLYFSVDPFMQSRGAPASFGSLKEEPLRASWPAMLVDPSWYEIPSNPSVEFRMSLVSF